MEHILQMNKVTKEFKNKTAVDNVSFTIGKGEVVAILGPNGAGKTTSIMMMLGLLEPTSGSVRLFDKHPKEKRVREKIGAMLQEVSVIDALKTREVIQLFRSYYPSPMPYQELITLTALSDDELEKRANKLSGGQKRRLGFALAMAGDPELLFFDEPTVGLDVTSRKLFWESVKHLQEKGKTILFTTHYLQEAEDAAGRVILFAGGKIIGDGTPREITAKLTRQSVSFAANSLISLTELNSLPHVSGVYEKDGRISLVTEDSDAVLAALFKMGLPVSDIQIQRGKLEDAFEQLTANKEAV
ncbi:ABC transporter ATP-binding protein [Bacillus sp. FJAT-27251]|uniref:ABC transporter ATP-binding protein n=1 Tax=Bacillus sp. FJAT-27251 TaxID=1684142 RepID=UPI0006A777DE|nr:ABC transporter ATP-binding protein [Bacillus sp. FJAT-27251]